MSVPTAAPSEWVELRLAPFVLGRNAEPSEADMQRDADLMHWLVTLPSFPSSIWVEWDAGIVCASVPDIAPECCDPEDEEYIRSASSHPLEFREAARRSFDPEAADVLSGAVEAFWGILVERFAGFVAEGIVEVHARGGPQPSPSHGFRSVPADLWASSKIDWGSGVFRTPDGHVYFSVRVRRVAAEPAAAARSSRAKQRPQVEAASSSAPRETSGVPDGFMMNVRQAAAFVNLSVSQLNKIRGFEQGPPFHRLGRRILYSKADLVKYLEQCRTNVFEAGS